MAYLGAGVTQWEVVTKSDDEMAPTTNRASDHLDGVEEINRRRAKFCEMAALGILGSILNTSGLRSASDDEATSYQNWRDACPCLALTLNWTLSYQSAPRFISS
jgi:hypothetical protein